MKLKNRVAVVSGAGRNIGECICKKLAEEGAKIAVLDMDPGRAANVASAICDAGGEAIPVIADVSSEDDVMQILETRDEGMMFCEKTETNPDRCITLEQADLEGPIFPPSSLPALTFVYTVIAEAQLGDVERSVEAVLDFTSPTNPRVLFWRMQ